MALTFQGFLVGGAMSHKAWTRGFGVCWQQTAFMSASNQRLVERRSSYASMEGFLHLQLILRRWALFSSCHLHCCCWWLWVVITDFTDTAVLSAENFQLDTLRVLLQGSLLLTINYEWHQAFNF